MMSNEKREYLERIASDITASDTAIALPQFIKALTADRRVQVLEVCRWRRYNNSETFITSCKAQQWMFRGRTCPDYCNFCGGVVVTEDE